MSWYIVTKTIKGKQYRYRQRTYRDGARVRTESQYIGPVAGDGRVASRKPTRTPGDARPGAPGDTTEEWKEEPTPSIAPPSTLILKADPERLERVKVSARSLAAEESRVMQLMQRNGIETESLASVVVAFAGSVGRRRSIFTGKYIVTLPRLGGNRTRFKQEYRRSLAHRWLDALEEDDPFAFDHLRTEMDAAHRQTKHALTRYLWSTNASGKWTLSLQLLWTRQLPPWFRSHVKPEKLGLVDHGAVSGWRSDTANLMAEIMQRGHDRTLKRYVKELVIATRVAEKKQRAFKEAFRFSSKRRKHLQASRRATARRDALRATLRKLDALKPMMQ